MAIPVANPPPSEPPPVRDAPTVVDGDAVPLIRGGGGPSPVVRGCLIAGAFGLFVACALGSALAYSCAGLFAAGTTQLVRNITDGYRASAVRAHEETACDADLRRLVALDAEGHLSLLALSILNNRYEDARRDGLVDTDELHHGMELIHDIVLGDGEIDLDAYPGGR